jgi:bifunctional non-homologous end joining protein LigD
MSTRTVAVTHPEKLLFPDDGITKGDLVEYYRGVADTMLPYMREHPVAMHRFPDGIHGESFFQKSASKYFPEWIETTTLPKKGGHTTYVVCNDAATLVYLANQNCITLHLLLAPRGSPAPDRMIFDLDPSIDDMRMVRDGARRLHAILDKLGLPSYLMTSGSRGLHIWVPLDGTASFEEVGAFADDVGVLLAAQSPDTLTMEFQKADRGDRVFVDTLRNRPAQHAAAPYAVRALPGAPVATPIGWDELKGIDPQRYTLRNLFRRLARKDDPWAGMAGHTASLEGARERLADLQR